MATKTIVIAKFDSKRVRYEVDYDDVTNFVTALRAVNDSHLGPTPGSSSGRVWLTTDPSRAFPPGSGTDPTQARITPAGTTETRSVSTGAAVRLALTVVSHNGVMQPSNLDGEFAWPV